MEIEPKLDLFVPISNEDGYLEARGIRRTKLDNGITLLSTTRLVEDAREAAIHINFQTGSYNDPQGLAGAHHLLEHVCMDPKVTSKAPTIGAHLNALTSSHELKFMLYGSANSEVPGYGIWGFIPNLRVMVDRPLAMYANVQQAIEIQKGICLREIEERTDPQVAGSYLFKKTIVFAADNPRFHSAGGTQEELSRITVEDLEKLGEQVLIPDGTLISAYSEGEAGLGDLISHKLIEQFRDFPRFGTKCRPVKLSSMDNLSPEFQLGSDYLDSTETSSRLRNIDFSWLFKPQGIIDDLSLSRIAPILSDRINHYLRNSGLCYGAFFTKDSLNVLRLCSLRFSLAERADLIRFVRGTVLDSIKRDISTISDKELDEVNLSEILKEKAVPMSRLDTFSLVINNLHRQGRIVDIDKIQELRRGLTAQHLRLWIERFLDQDPALLITA